MQVSHFSLEGGAGGGGAGGGSGWLARRRRTAAAVREHVGFGMGWVGGGDCRPEDMVKKGCRDRWRGRRSDQTS